MLIREEIEALEQQTLSPFAAFSNRTQGRTIDEEPDIIRTCYMRDRDRIIHSKSFRRLKHKTQVFIAQGNDHYRTRLTHTLEVNQISQTVGKALRLNLDLIEAIALGHDVKEENSCGTLEGQVVRYADKIAYVQHDIDDSIRAGVLAFEDIPCEFLSVLGKTHGERIGTLVNDLVLISRINMNNGEKKVSLSSKIEQALLGLRKFMFGEVYKGHYCQEQRQGAAHIVEYLFDYYLNKPEKLPHYYRQIVETEGIERGVADYISGMTDNYCIASFKEKVLPHDYI
jgi:dGTPase